MKIFSPDLWDQFFCGLAPMLELSCSETMTIMLSDFITCFSDPISPFLFMLTSILCTRAATVGHLQPVEQKGWGQGSTEENTQESHELHK